MTPYLFRVFYCFYYGKRDKWENTRDMVQASIPGWETSSLTRQKPTEMELSWRRQLESV